MRYLLAGVFLSLVGCAPADLRTKNPHSEDEVRSKCFKEFDKFTNKTVWYSLGYWTGGVTMFYLGTANPKGSMVSIHLVFSAKEWLFLSECYAVGGKKLITVVKDRKVDQYGYVNENVTAVIERELLNPKGEEEIEVKFTGQRGNFVLRIPAFYIRGFYSFLETQVQKDA